MRKAVVSSKGQITIPSSLRERMNLTERREVTIEAGPDGAVIVRPVRSILHLAGSLRPKGGTLSVAEEKRRSRAARATTIAKKGL